MNDRCSECGVVVGRKHLPDCRAKERADPDDDAKFIPLLARASDGVPWVVLGGPDYAVQIRHPDGGHLRISWDGTITPRAAPPEVSQ